MCSADPSVKTPLKGTAFLFTAGPNGGTPGATGMCGFQNAQLPKDLMYGAIDSKLFGIAAHCGGCLRVNSGATNVEVEIIDIIQPLSDAHGYTISVDSLAMAKLAPSGGNPDVQFSFVPCSFSGNIQLAFRGSLDPSVTVMNHVNQLKSIQLTTPSVSVSFTRQDYNLWTPPTSFKFGGGAVNLDLTDIFDNVVHLPNLTVSTALKDSGKQFPKCPQ